MDYGVIREGLMVQDGRMLLKVTSVHPHYLRARILLEGTPAKPPKRSTITTYTKAQAEKLSLASDRLIARAVEFYRKPAAPKTKKCPRCAGTGKVLALETETKT